jgi:adenylate cyclase
MRARVETLAKQWQRKGHTLGFGVGIASGYATLGQIGFEQRREYTAIGSVINLASRLCDEARPGQIVIGQRAFSAIEQHVESASVGKLRLKGFAKPVPAYEILSWRGQPQSQTPPATNQVG